MKTYLLEKTKSLLVLVSAHEIQAGLENQTLSPKARIFDDHTSRWIEIQYHPDWRVMPQPQQVRDVTGTGHETAIIPTRLLVTSSAAVATAEAKTAVAVQAQPNRWPAIWYYLAGTSRMGPLDYPQMIRKIQQGQLRSEMLIWRSGMPDWTMASMVSDFQSGTLRQIFERNWHNLGGAFVPRKFKRVPYQCEFVLHNKKVVWSATSFELGAGGLGVVASTDGFQLGQEYYLHQIGPGPGPNVNSRVRVLSRSRNGMRPGEAKFALEFVDINRRDQQEIKVFTDSQPG